MNDDAALRSIQTRLKTAGFYAGPVDGDWGDGSDDAFDLALSRAVGATLAKPPTARPRALVHADYVEAAGMLDGDVAKVITVKTVESGGAWFTDVRKSILDLDGPGGFLDGPDLPKILYEAKVFHVETGGKHDRTHPNLSSPVWDRRLYVGGQGEYERLHRAMQLNRPAALKACSWGLFQILGANHKLAGFADVEAYVEAMKRGEREQLLAFVAFVRNSPGMLAKYRLISADPVTCRPFCRAYNGAGYATHGYDTRTATEYRRAKAANP
jgi:hypothetical protein